MTPIELNGKTFCSNCGLTIANNAPEPVKNVINPAPETVSNVETNEPEEIEFPVVPELVEATATVPDEAPMPITDYPTNEAASPEQVSSQTIANAVPITQPTDFFGQLAAQPKNTIENLGHKLNVFDEDKATREVAAVVATPAVSKPITEQAERDLGLKPELPVVPPVHAAPTVVESQIPTEGAALESKISDLLIPNEEDFTRAEAETNIPSESYIELANPGSEQSALEASGILLDILAEGHTAPKTDVPMVEPDIAPVIMAAKTSSSVIPAKEIELETKPLDPVAEPEIPKTTETAEKDDIYELPKEIKKGLRKKKPGKAAKVTAVAATAASLDSKIEAEIDKLEDIITDTPETKVELTPDQAANFDPDALPEKSKIIKEYFTASIDRDKAAHTSKKKKDKKNKTAKIIAIIAGSIIGIAALGGGGYAGYFYLKPTPKPVVISNETATFATTKPVTIPEGYTQKSEQFIAADKTYEVVYEFTADPTKTITYKQIQAEDAKAYITNYLATGTKIYLEKTVEGITFTEVEKNNLLWSKDGFVYIIEANDFTFDNALLYKMAGVTE
jgi:flagellar basal body-associated protein FliL